MKTTVSVILAASFATFLAQTGQVNTGIENLPYVVGAIGVWGLTISVFA